MGYQYIRHRCSNAAWARVVSLRVAASTTDQCVVTKAGASGTSSRWLLSLAAIDLTLEKSAQTLQEIIRKAASEFRCVCPVSPLKLPGKSIPLSQPTQRATRVNPRACKCKCHASASPHF